MKSELNGTPRLPKELLAAYRETLSERDQRIAELQDTNDQLEADRSRLSKQNKDLSDEVANLKGQDLSLQFERLTSIWLRKKGLCRPPEFVYRDDPVYGQLFVDPRLFPVFFDPLFQRLNYIRQLSFAYLTFPSASHTRLSHCLGVARNARAAMRAIFEKGWVYGRNGRRRIELSWEQWEALSLKAQLCGLLHDIGHGPFGHALDKLVPYIDGAGRRDVPDKVYSLKYIETYLADSIKAVGKDAGFGPSDVSAILDKEQQADLKGYDKLLADLIDSPLDVDGMDFLARDGHMTGLGMGYSNIEALIEHMCPFEDNGRIQLTYEESALPHIENFLYAHDIMYINCYEHPRKLGAERLLVKLCQHLVEKGLTRDTLMLLTDEQLITTLSLTLPDGGCLRNCLRALQENCSYYPAATYNLSKWNADKNLVTLNDGLADEVKAWCERKSSREPHLKYVFVEAPNSWEDRICDLANINVADSWKVLVTVPGYDAKQRQESGAQILRKVGQNSYESVELFERSSVMRTVVTNLMPLRAMIHVLISEETTEAEADRAAAAGDQIFLKSANSG